MMTEALTGRILRYGLTMLASRLLTKRLSSIKRVLRAQLVSIVRKPKEAEAPYGFRQMDQVKYENTEYQFCRSFILGLFIRTMYK